MTKDEITTQIDKLEIDMLKAEIEHLKAKIGLADSLLELYAIVIKERK